MTRSRRSFLRSRSALLIAALLIAVSAKAAEPVVHFSHDEIEARYADRDSRFAEVDGVRLHYKDQGSGPAILLIHGSLGDVSDWEGWVKVLADHYRVVRFDLPGFGISGPIANGNYSIDRSLALIDGLMDTLELEQFAIGGVSYGGPVAFRYAATRTGRVTGLVIMNSAGIEFGKQRVDPETGNKDFYEQASTGISRDFIAASLRRAFSNKALVTDAMIERKFHLANVRGRAEEGATMIKQYVRGDPYRVLSHVRAPVLVLWGGAEQSLSQETADEFVSAVRNAREVRKVVQAGGDHWMHVDLAEPTARTVKKFLDDFVAN